MNKRMKLKVEVENLESASKLITKAFLKLYEEQKNETINEKNKNTEVRNRTNI